MQNPIDPESTLIAALVLFAVVGFLSKSLLVLVAMVLPTFVIGAIILERLHKSNYKDAPIRKNVAQILGFKVHNCGCVYHRSHSSYSTNVPPSEWIDKEKVYERSMKGAKVRFSKKKAGMKRCTQCGNHYHIVEEYSNKNNRHIRTCWPEEEPEVREELNHRVIES